jgi:hypothetical protein
MKSRRKPQPGKTRKCLIHNWYWVQVGGIQTDAKGRQFVWEQKACRKCPVSRKPRKRLLR